MINKTVPVWPVFILNPGAVIQKLRAFFDDIFLPRIRQIWIEDLAEMSKYSSINLDNQK